MPDGLIRNQIRSCFDWFSTILGYPRDHFLVKEKYRKKVIGQVKDNAERFESYNLESQSNSEIRES